MRNGRVRRPFSIQPSVAQASRKTPKAAEAKACSTTNVSPCASSAGESQNMKGTMKVARPSFTAITLVFHISAPAMEAAAKEASATGGVMADRMAK